MNVLVDTSVWIEFFNPKPRFETARLELLIEENLCVTCLPVRAEVLSGKMAPKNRSIILRAFDSLAYADPEWKLKETWDNVADIALRARREKSTLPGLVDRMILLTAQKSGVALWTFDLKLRKLAVILGIPLSN